MSVRISLVLLCIYVFVDKYVKCEEGSFFLKAAKNVPRIGRRSKSSSDDSFEKFFLKASKSVPRIGRRGPSVNEEFLKNANILLDGNAKDNNIKYPVWSELAERYEYDPELFTLPHLLTQLDEALGDDPSVYDWDKVRIKRTSSQAFGKATNKELNEYKF